MVGDPLARQGPNGRRPLPKTQARRQALPDSESGDPRQGHASGARAPATESGAGESAASVTRLLDKALADLGDPSLDSASGRRTRDKARPDSDDLLLSIFDYPRERSLPPTFGLSSPLLLLFESSLSSRGPPLASTGVCMQDSEPHCHLQSLLLLLE